MLLFQVAIVVNFLSLTFAQQTFESRGENYHAKVVIHRANPPYNEQHQQAANPYQKPHPHVPWKQGDRITKQEIIQNVAKALVTRKKSSSEREAERRKKNEEALQEYAMMQARLAQKMKEEKENPHPHPPPPNQQQQQQPQYQPPSTHLHDSWNAGPASRRWRRRRNLKR